MSQWPSIKDKRLLVAFFSVGWKLLRVSQNTLESLRKTCKRSCYLPESAKAAHLLHQRRLFSPCANCASQDVE
jgi:hypothetical protein